MKCYAIHCTIIYQYKGNTYERTITEIQDASKEVYAVRKIARKYKVSENDIIVHACHIIGYY